MATLMSTRNIFVLLFLSIIGLCLLLYSERDRNLQLVPFVQNVLNSGELYENCTMKSNVFFLKVPKCASGTTMVLLWRFVMAHNLNPLTTAIPSTGLSKPLTQLRLLDHPPGESYNVIANHLDYSINKNEIPKMMPNDTACIGIVREPKAQFQSHLLWNHAYKSMRRRVPPSQAKNTTDGELLLDTITNNTESLKRFLNSQSRYFGIRAASFEIDIKEVFNTFDLILIADYYDESLVLLKRYMCWDLKDIVYNKVHAQKYSVDQKNIMSNNRISAWFSEKNYNDFVFYQKCLENFQQKVSNEGNRFHEEVEYFQSVLRRVTTFCSSEVTDILHFERSRWNKEFNISASDCELLKLDPVPSIHRVVSWQTSRLQKLRSPESS
ncbi:hypothetical protein ScPMuIL_005879 [Solemya velum]